MINRAVKWPGTSRLLSLPSARNEHFLFAEMECTSQLITIFHLIVAVTYLSLKKLLCNTTRTQTGSVAAESVAFAIPPYLVSHVSSGSGQKHKKGNSR